MTGFELTTVDQVRKIMLKSPSKTYDLDLISTELLIVLLVSITKTVNLSLLSRFIPDIFKISQVMPLLEKHQNLTMT